MNKFQIIILSLISIISVAGMIAMSRWKPPPPKPPESKLTEMNILSFKKGTNYSRVVDFLGKPKMEHETKDGIIFCVWEEGGSWENAGKDGGRSVVMEFSADHKLLRTDYKNLPKY